jgi:hypothetical protein
MIEEGGVIVHSGIFALNHCHLEVFLDVMFWEPTSLNKWCSFKSNGCQMT